MKCNVVQQTCPPQLYNKHALRSCTINMPSTAVQQTSGQQLSNMPACMPHTALQHACHTRQRITQVIAHGGATPAQHCTRDDRAALSCTHQQVVIPQVAVRYRHLSRQRDARTVHKSRTRTRHTLCSWQHCRHSPRHVFLAAL